MFPFWCGTCQDTGVRENPDGYCDCEHGVALIALLNELATDERREDHNAIV